MAKTKKGDRFIRILIVATVIGMVAFAGWQIWKDETRANKSKKMVINNSGQLFNNSNDLTEGKRVDYVGKVESIDLSDMKNDGPGVFVVKPMHEDAITIYLDAGESACDREAIKRPDVTIGDVVRIHGDKGSDGVIRICERGTYIKK